MKTLILMAYFNRERMVRLALESVKLSEGDWELAFVDDGSNVPGEDIVREMFSPEQFREQITCYNTHDSVEAKEARGGSRFGEFWNHAMKNSNADIGIMLCDDDALFPGYLDGLSSYYQENEDIVYSYSHLSAYDPKVYYNSVNDVPFNLEFFNTAIPPMLTPINAGPTPIIPSCRVDSSQVSWRLPEINEDEIAFPSPQTADLDASFYEVLFDHYGYCVYNGLISQFKGWHTDQMGNRRTALYDLRDV